MSFRIVYPELPPTSNKLYFRGTILTKKARTYAERFAAYVARWYGPELNQFKVGPEVTYALHLRFFFDSLENENWFKATDEERRVGFVNRMVYKKSKDGTKTSERKNVELSRYKKIDLDNRIKLLQDCIRDAIGVDDSQIFAGSQEKHQDPSNPRVEIFVQLIPHTLFGLK